MVSLLARRVRGRRGVSPFFAILYLSFRATANMSEKRLEDFEEKTYNRFITTKTIDLLPCLKLRPYQC